MTKNEIIDFLKSNKEYLHKNFGVISIGLFGSFAKDRDRIDSDIDIAVEIESKNKFRSFFSLKYYLEEHFKKEVNLGIESSLKPLVKQHIKNEIIYV